MILSDVETLKEPEKGFTTNEPFARSALGTNSYDVHLGPFWAKSQSAPLDTMAPIPFFAGEMGLKNHWISKSSVKALVRVYAGMPMDQLIYFQPHERVMTSYDQKESAKYTDKSDQPQESMMWKNSK